MGGTDGYATFTAYNWRDGLAKLQERAAQEYGHRDGYSGAINSCSFTYMGDKSRLSKKELEKYISERMDNLGNGDGEIVCLGQAGFNVIKTVITPVPRLRFDPTPYLKGLKKPAILVEMTEYGTPKIVCEGTQAELKAKAHTRLRSCNYNKDCFILSKRGNYLCSGEVKFVKTTKKTSTETLLVLSLYKFYSYGWYRE